MQRSAFFGGFQPAPQTPGPGAGAPATVAQLQSQSSSTMLALGRALGAPGATVGSGSRNYRFPFSRKFLWDRTPLGQAEVVDPMDKLPLFVVPTDLHTRLGQPGEAAAVLSCPNGRHLHVVLQDAKAASELGTSPATELVPLPAASSSARPDGGGGGEQQPPELAPLAMALQHSLDRKGMARLSTGLALGRLTLAPRTGGGGGSGGPAGGAAGGAAASLSATLLLPAAPLVLTPLYGKRMCEVPLAAALAAAAGPDEEAGVVKTGYVTLDQARSVVPLAADDPRVYSTPLVGVWARGVGVGTQHPTVYAAALAFAYGSVLPDRATQPDGSFLLLLFGCDSAVARCFEARFVEAGGGSGSAHSHDLQHQQHQGAGGGLRLVPYTLRAELACQTAAPLELRPTYDAAAAAACAKQLVLQASSPVPRGPSAALASAVSQALVGSGGGGGGLGAAATPSAPGLHYSGSGGSQLLHAYLTYGGYSNGLHHQQLAAAAGMYGSSGALPYGGDLRGSGSKLMTSPSKAMKIVAAGVAPATGMGAAAAVVGGYAAAARDSPPLPRSTSVPTPFRQGAASHDGAAAAGGPGAVAEEADARDGPPLDPRLSRHRCSATLDAPPSARAQPGAPHAALGDGGDSGGFGGGGDGAPGTRGVMDTPAAVLGGGGAGRWEGRHGGASAAAPPPWPGLEGAGGDDGRQRQAWGTAPPGPASQAHGAAQPQHSQPPRHDQGQQGQQQGQQQQQQPPPQQHHAGRWSQPPHPPHAQPATMHPAGPWRGGGPALASESLDQWLRASSGAANGGVGAKAAATAAAPGTAVAVLQPPVSVQPPPQPSRPHQGAGERWGDPGAAAAAAAGSGAVQAAAVRAAPSAAAAGQATAAAVAAAAAAGAAWARQQHGAVVAATAGAVAPGAPAHPMPGWLGPFRAWAVPGGGAQQLPQALPAETPGDPGGSASPGLGGAQDPQHMGWGPLPSDPQALAQEVLQLRALVRELQAQLAAAEAARSGGVQRLSSPPQQQQQQQQAPWAGHQDHPASGDSSLCAPHPPAASPTAADERAAPTLASPHQAAPHLHSAHPAARGADLASTAAAAHQAAAAAAAQRLADGLPPTSRPQEPSPAHAGEGHAGEGAGGAEGGNAGSVWSMASLRSSIASLAPSQLSASDASSSSSSSGGGGPGGIGPGGSAPPDAASAGPGAHGSPAAPPAAGAARPDTPGAARTPAAVTAAATPAASWFRAGGAAAAVGMSGGGWPSAMHSGLGARSSGLRRPRRATSSSSSSDGDGDDGAGGGAGGRGARRMGLYAPSSDADSDAEAGDRHAGAPRSLTSGAGALLPLPSGTAAAAAAGASTLASTALPAPAAAAPPVAAVQLVVHTKYVPLDDDGSDSSDVEMEEQLLKKYGIARG